MLKDDPESLFKSRLADHGGAVLKVARAYTFTAEDCQDLVQGILLQVRQSLPQFQGRAGIRLSLPWTWYLMVPACLWVAGFMLTDRMRHNRRPIEPGEPLRQHVENSLAQDEHQIGLLRNVFWWYLLSLALPLLVFVGQLAMSLKDETPD